MGGEASLQFFHSLSSKPELVWRWRHSVVSYGRLAGPLLGAGDMAPVLPLELDWPDANANRPPHTLGPEVTPIVR